MILDPKLLASPMTYESYLEYWNDIVSEKSPETARYKEQNLYKYAHAALEITQKVEKTLTLEKKLFNEIIKWCKTAPFSLNISMIAEPWCGDISHILPVLYAIQVASEEKISVSIYLRDSNEELMNLFLTNGGKAIPILLFLNQNELVAKWGPRTAAASEKLTVLKSQNLPTSDLYRQLSEWYEQDKTKAFQDELYTIFRNLMNN
jgi:hypothetical protein